MLPPLDKVDRTKPFTKKVQELVNKLPRAKRLAYMKRPNSGEVMTPEQIRQHYQSSNYAEVRYHSAGGGGIGSPNPPHMRGL